MTSDQRTESAERPTSPEYRGPEPSIIRDLTRRIEMHDLILNSIHNGVMVTDAEGYVIHFNEPYGRFLGVDPRAQIGRHCQDVVENTRMHIVAKTGRPEINQSHRIKGQSMVVQRIPIMKDGRVIAVFGQVMFKDVRDVGRLARKLSLLESKVRLYEEELATLRSTRYTIDSIVGVSRVISRSKKDALQAADNDLPVLITGESGTGKELFAQAIHSAGPRRARPFVRINCSAIPRDLVESELFGYEKGAFTGASSGGKPGKFELAKGGTVFLDEIGELPIEIQPKLLRILEEKEFERVGGTRLIKTDFRLVSATNQNLEKMMATNSFRKDLFYRLNVVPLHLPPLRDHREDIGPLINHLIAQFRQDTPAAGQVNIHPQAESALINHDWPGNVRELSNVMERTLAGLKGDLIRLEDLPYYLQRVDPAAAPGGLKPLSQAVAEAERQAIKAALHAAQGNKARAARLLGVHRTHLYKKMEKLNLGSQGETDLGAL